MADTYLGILLLLFGITFLFNFFNISGVFLKYPSVIFFDMGIPFLLGPVTWFYVVSLTRGKRYRYNRTLHLVPALLIYVVFLDVVFLPPEDKLELLNMPAGEADLRFKIQTIFQLVPVPVYVVMSFYALKKYKIRLRRTHSAIEQLTHKWLSVLLFLFLLFWLILSVGLILINYFPIWNGGAMIFNLGLMIFAILIGIYGYRKNTLVLKISESEGLNPVQGKELSSYGLPDIEQFFATQRPFLQSELTLNELSVQIKIPPHTLSNIINSHYGQTFFEYINSWRIQEFKEKISRGEHLKYSILSVAYDSGFNSRTAFYRFFKKNEGISPGDYIKNFEASSGKKT